MATFFLIDLRNKKVRSTDDPDDAYECAEDEDIIVIDATNEAVVIDGDGDSYDVDENWR